MEGHQLVVTIDFDGQITSTEEMQEVADAIVDNISDITKVVVKSLNFGETEIWP